jgi:cell division protein FtsQ
VQPMTGRGKGRGSSDALLARGIAVQRRSFAGLTLPGFAGSRRIAKRRPNRVVLGRVRGNGKWRFLALLFIGGAGAHGVWLSGESERVYGELKGGVEALAVTAGFGVKRITVEGQQHTTDADITAALATGPDTMMLAFDTDAAKARLERVSWVRHAQVMRLLPSTLQVVVEERVPFAVWQSGGHTYVVDAEGFVLAPALREAYAGLPLVVGEGAEKSAAALFDMLAPYNDLKQQLIAALRVGDRRWTLKLASGLEIMLPDDNVAEALQTVAGLDRDRGLLGRNITAVDLRLADRVTVRLLDSGSETAGSSGATAPREVPTASTKAAQAKGST